MYVYLDENVACMLSGQRSDRKPPFPIDAIWAVVRLAWLGIVWLASRARAVAGAG